MRRECRKRTAKHNRIARAAHPVLVKPRVLFRGVHPLRQQLIPLFSKYGLQTHLLSLAEGLSWIPPPP